MPLTTFGATGLLKIFSGELAAPSTLYLGLHTAAVPISANEVGATGYARQAVTWAAPAGGGMVNAAALAFTAVGALWTGYPIAYAAIWDAASSGNCWWYEPLNDATTSLAAGPIGIVAGGSGYVSGDVGLTVYVPVPLATLAISGTASTFGGGVFGGVGGSPSFASLPVMITAVAAGLVTGVKLASGLSIDPGFMPMPGPYFTAPPLSAPTTGTGMSIEVVWKPGASVVDTLGDADAITVPPGGLEFLLF